MRHSLIFSAVLAASLAGAVAPASAQFFHFSFGSSDRIAPSRVPALVRGMGMDPAGPVFREGPDAYSVQAFDRNGRRVRVVIDSFNGETIAIERLPGPAQVARAAPLPYDYRGPGVYLDEEEDEPIIQRAPAAPRVQPKPVPKKVETPPPVVAAKPPATEAPARPAVKPVPAPAAVQTAPAKPAEPAVAARPAAPDIVVPVQPAPVVIPPAAEIRTPAVTAQPESAPGVTQLPGGQGVRIVGPASPYTPRKDEAPKTADTPKPATESTVPAANGLDFD